MGTLWRTKAGRWVFAASSVGILMLVPLIVAITSAIGSVHAQAPSPPATPLAPLAWSSVPSWLWLLAVGGFVVAFGIAVVQTVEKYRRLTYDPTWALKYQDMFTALWDQTEERPRAAWLLLRCKNDLADIQDKATRKKLEPIDEVLDVLEDIGFYTKGGLISPEAAHHHFYYWLTGYLDAARAYLNAWKVKEPERWSHLDWLRKVTDAVERGAPWKPAPPALSAEECAEFLIGEIDNWTPETAKNTREATPPV